MAENLTPDQEAVLAKLWAMFYTACAVQADPSAQQLSPGGTPSFAPSPKPAEGVDENDGFVHGDVRLAGDSRDMRLFLRQYGGQQLRRHFWQGMVRGDHPDAVMLRYLRARKWDVHAALNSICSTTRYRVEKNVQQLVRDGEEGLASTVGGRKLLQKGIASCLGHAPGGQPIVWFEVGAHLASAQTQAELEKAIILMQEWLNLSMPPGSPPMLAATNHHYVPSVERKVVVFNLTKFGLRNMDWWAVFFLCNSLERWYPETLERVYVHNPPWIFRPIWAILRALLDPGVRDKVRLTSTVEEMDLIPPDEIPSNLVEGGQLHGWSWRWEPPVTPGENEDMRQKLGGSETEARLQHAFDDAVEEFESSTRRWMRYLKDGANQMATDRSLAVSLHPENVKRADGHSSADDADAESESDVGEMLANPTISSGAGDAAQASARHSSSSHPPATASNVRTSFNGQVHHRASVGSLASRASRVSRASRGSRGSRASHTPAYRKLKRRPTAAESLSQAAAHRDVVATKLRLAWLELQPFRVGLKMADRQHVARTDGTICWGPLFAKYLPAPSSYETNPEDCQTDDPKFKIWGRESSIPVLQKLLQPLCADDSD